MGFSDMEFEIECRDVTFKGKNRCVYCMYVLGINL
jgi:hypothetical protein